jgi:sporulation protein YlmC with PRC-barrel domain
MKPVLGKKLRNRRVVSASGLEIGEVLDATFEGDRIVDLVVRPDVRTKEVQEYVGRNGTLSVPFESVKAIGRYVVIEFPVAKF